MHLITRCIVVLMNLLIVSTNIFRNYTDLYMPIAPMHRYRVVASFHRPRERHTVLMHSDANVALLYAE